MSTDGAALVQDAKARAKKQAAQTKGASPTILLSTAKKSVDGGLLIQDTDLYGALSRFYFSAYVMQIVIDSAEFKSKAAPLNKDAKEFQRVISYEIAPIVKKLEAKLRGITQDTAAPPDPSNVADSVPSSPVSSDDGPNQKFGGSIQERMKALNKAGMNTSTAEAPSTLLNNISKRYSGQQRPASTTNGDPNDSPSTAAPLSPTPSSSFTPSTIATSIAPGSSRHSHKSSGSLSSLNLSPSHSPTVVTPSLGSISEDLASLVLNGTHQHSTQVNGYSDTPSSTSTVTLTHTSPSPSNGIPPSPRHHDIQSFATPRSRPTSMPPSSTSSPILAPKIIRPTSNQPPTPSALQTSFPQSAPTPTETATPSLSAFNSHFPTIETLDSTYPSIPEAPAAQLPVFPSVPNTKVGSGPPSSWKKDPTSSSSSGAMNAGGSTRPHSSSLSGTPNGNTTPLGRPASSSVSTTSKHYSTNSISNSSLMAPNGTGGSNSSAGTHRPSSGAGSASTSPQPQPTKTQTARSPLPSTPSYTAAPSYPVAPQPRPEIPITQAMLPKMLWKFLNRDTNGGTQVLLLDVRELAEHRREKISGLSICLEPTLLMRRGIDSTQIEESLVLDQVGEGLFKDRHLFDLVVMYDQGSTSLEAPGSTHNTDYQNHPSYQRLSTKSVANPPSAKPIASGPLKVLNDVIYTKEFRKTLKRPPVLLVGGLEAWKRDLGGVWLDGWAVTAVNAGSVMNGDSQANHQREGAMAKEGGADTSPPQNERVRTLHRKSTLLRSSSSGNISVYNRQIPDDTEGMYSSHGISPISYPTASTTSPIPAPTPARPLPVPPNGTFANLPQPPPPVASGLHSSSPISRVRSNYAEQAQHAYTGSTTSPIRAAIDYPTLSAQNLVKYPEPAATTSLERADPRARLNAATISATPSTTVLSGSNGQQIELGGKINIGGKVYDLPPVIQSYYPVEYWTHTQQVRLSGLKNLGNTCYMNSIIQCLSATVPFARFFIDGRWTRAINQTNPMGKMGKVARAFALMVHEMWQGDQTYLTPYSFRRSICEFAPQFGGSDQHDSQEFLSFLLDGLHEDLNRPLKRIMAQNPTPEREAELENTPVQIAGAQEWKLYQLRDDSIIVDYFQGQFRSRLQCLTCGTTSTTYNAFMYLSLPIPTRRGVSRVNLHECLEAFVKKEVLEASDAWHCPKCKELRRATKELTLSRLPPVLLIHLKRFSFKGPFTDKLETTVDFPLKGLDLTGYMPPPLPTGADKSMVYAQNGGAPPRFDDPRTQMPPYKYDLYAVTNHFGTLTSGHYTSFISTMGQWAYCDDSRISPAPSQNVMGRPAYILFYRRVS